MSKEWRGKAARAKKMPEAAVALGDASCAGANFSTTRFYA